MNNLPLPVNHHVLRWPCGNSGDYTSYTLRWCSLRLSMLVFLERSDISEKEDQVIINHILKKFWRTLGAA
jgi:hypothetical protein